MSKANATENDFVKFVFNAVAMPSYGAALQLNLHTDDLIAQQDYETFLHVARMAQEIEEEELLLLA